MERFATNRSSTELGQDVLNFLDINNALSNCQRQHANIEKKLGKEAADRNNKCDGLVPRADANPLPGREMPPTHTGQRAESRPESRSEQPAKPRVVFNDELGRGGSLDVEQPVRRTTAQPTPMQRVDNYYEQADKNKKASDKGPDLGPAAAVGFVGGAALTYLKTGRLGTALVAGAIIGGAVQIGKRTIKEGINDKLGFELF